MTLHTLNAAPRSPAFGDCIRLLGKNDAVLLLGDGVYAALANTAPLDELLQTEAEIYLLKPDATAAGILDLVDNTVNIVDFDAFVTLTEDHPRQQAWY